MEIVWDVPEEKHTDTQDASLKIQKEATPIHYDSSYSASHIEMVWDVAEAKPVTGTDEKDQTPRGVGEPAPQAKIQEEKKPTPPGESVYSGKLKEILYAVDKNASSSEDLYMMCERCLDQVLTTLEAERGFILLYDSGTQAMDVYSTYNIDPDSLLISEPVSHSILNTVSNEAKPVIISNALDDPRFSDKTSVVLSGLRSIICVPISMEGGLAGILYIDNRSKNNAFTEENLHFLNDYAQKIGERVANYFPQISPKLGTKKAR